MKSKLNSILPKHEKTTLLSKVDENIVFGTPLEENLKQLPRKVNKNIKSYLPRQKPNNTNELPNGFL